MNRERIAWLLSLLLITVAAFRSPSSAQRDNDYRFVRTLVDINRQVQANYVEDVDSEKLEKSAIDGLLNQLDPFTMYVPPAMQGDFDRMLDGTFRGVGIQLNQLDDGTIEVVTPIEGSPALKAGVLAGDIILKVNGESIEGIRLQDVIGKVSGPIGTEVRLTVRHLSGEERELTMTRQEVVVPTVKGFTRKADNSWDWYVNPEHKIAYMRITQFTSSTFDAYKSAIDQMLKDGMKGLILDLRWNPGGQLNQAVDMIDSLLSQGTIVVTKGRNRPEQARVATAANTLPWFPMLVLVNEHSASAAEIVAGSLMDNKRAAVLGQRTYGKGSVQEVIPLGGSSGELKLTVAYYYLPSGRLVHKLKNASDWGVEPQIPVEMDDTTQREVLEARYNSERFHRADEDAATQPTTQPVDVQLQRAVDTMLLMTILQPSQAVAETAQRP